MTPILTVEDLRVHFGGVRAVDGVDLELERGRLYGVVGPNGSGKTTLVNAITRIGPTTSGRIVLEGEDITRAPAHELGRAGMARTFQAIRLVPSLTVRDNVLLGRGRHVPRRSRLDWRARRRDSERARVAADEAIEKLHLGHVASEYPGNLPYGTQRRVEIARALAGDPKVLLLDEPVAGMNREERQEIGGVIRALREEGLTQVLIEHDLRMILELCDHLLVMNFGRCVAQGDPRATAALPEVQEAYLGRRRHVAA